MTTDPTIVPDDKDWTWVLHQPCPDCAFDAEVLDVSATGDAVRALASAFTDRLASPSVRVRPTMSQWSTLEYACHVRDVFELFDERLHLMLDEDDPLFANWDQDVTAVEQRYAEQDPTRVGDELTVAAQAIARSFDAIEPDQWHRVGRRSDGARFTVDSFARYFLHDPVHHLWDIDQAATRPRSEVE